MDFRRPSSLLSQEARTLAVDLIHPLTGAAFAPAPAHHHQNYRESVIVADDDGGGGGLAKKVMQVLSQPFLDSSKCREILTWPVQHGLLRKLYAPMTRAGKQLNRPC